MPAFSYEMLHASSVHIPLVVRIVEENDVWPYLIEDGHPLKVPSSEISELVEIGKSRKFLRMTCLTSGVVSRPFTMLLCIFEHISWGSNPEFGEIGPKSQIDVSPLTYVFRGRVTNDFFFLLVGTKKLLPFPKK